MLLRPNVIGALLRYPFTWLALATVGGFEWLVWQWFQPGLVAGGAFLLLGLLVLLTWPVFATRSPSLLEQLIGAPDAEREKERQAKLQALEQDLNRFKAKQGVEQLRMLGSKLNTLTQVLRQRMNSGELTYSRYLGTAEQVYLSAVDNLQEVVVALTSVQSIDSQYIDKRLADLSDRSKGAETDEYSTLHQRQQLLEQQRTRVDDLYAQNETAMTVLTNAAVALASTKTERGDAAMDADSAINALEQLANRTSDYVQRSQP